MCKDNKNGLARVLSNSKVSIKDITLVTKVGFEPTTFGL